MSTRHKARQYLEYKCEEVGIETTLESENGTSKTCPKCGNKHKPTGRNYNFRLPCAHQYGVESHYHLDEANANKNCPACNLKMHRDVVGACNIRTRYLTGVLNGDDNFQSPTVKYLRIDHWSKSSSAAGVSRREGRKPYRRSLGVPVQLTLFPLSEDKAKTEQSVRYKT